MSHSKPRRAIAPVRRKSRIIVPLLSVLMIAAGIGVFVFLRPPDGPRDMNGHVVVPDDPIATSSSFMEASDMVIDDGGLGFQIPSVKLNVPLGSINDVGGVMSPSNFTSAFVVRNRGVGLDHATKGTVYIVTHSTQSGTAPGNFVQENQQVIVRPGDIIKADDHDYAVASSRIVKKTEIDFETDVWDETISGRLVFITCLLNGRSDSNIIIIATLT